MTEYSLVPHTQTPARSVAQVRVSLARNGDRLELRYIVTGPTGQLLLPPVTTAARSDGLWRTTCFELFLATEGTTYVEANFSPSTEWALYDFADYRSGMTSAATSTAPVITVDHAEGAVVVTVSIDLPRNATGAMALSAVIAETEGTKSYWALAHAPGQPDFHNRDCFIATLPAPERA